MFFDRESTVVITKFNNLSESVLTTYCKKFGTVLRCLIKTSTQSRNKDPYALIKFAEASSVSSILNHRNHTINGVHVVMRTYHQDTNNSSSTQTPPSLMSLTQQNQSLSSNNNNNNNNNDPKPTNYDQLVQENHALKYEIGNLQKSLLEAQTYSKTAYDTFQVLREKFEAEQALTNKLKSEYAAMVESYEARLKQLPSSSSVSSSIKTIVKDKIKEEPMDCHSHAKHSTNNALEMQIIKDHLEQAQIDLGKCQTENALLNAKLTSREQQFDIRFKELNNKYINVKKQYEHLSSCIKDFHAKLYPKKRLKSELKEDTIKKSDREGRNKSNDSNDDIVEIVMQVDPISS
ncbi:unnamed protein product [Rotaria sp. Silwood1]|nr:unnamed protein product [Rotaria sp. Silwood1]CAF3390407.1 unnamed protein product [Rotaria sp. Silwood1]CAF4562399.1 unnamed protein product [Rotaria sp. Silwood1]